MHASILLSAALATIGALAQGGGGAPISGNDVRLQLASLGQTSLVGSTVFTQNFNEVDFPAATVANAGPFDTIVLNLGPAVSDQAARCQIKDRAGNVIRVNRGANLEKSTFSKGAAWTFSNGPSDVGRIECPVAAPANE